MRRAWRWRGWPTTGNTGRTSSFWGANKRLPRSSPSLGVKEPGLRRRLTFAHYLLEQAPAGQVVALAQVGGDGMERVYPAANLGVAHPAATLADIHALTDWVIRVV